MRAYEEDDCVLDVGLSGTSLVHVLLQAKVLHGGMTTVARAH